MSESRNEQEDRRFVLSNGIRRESQQAVAEYFGDRYIQHNPQADDGPGAFIGFVRYLGSEYPGYDWRSSRSSRKAIWS